MIVMYGPLSAFLLVKCEKGIEVKKPMELRKAKNGQKLAFSIP